MKATELNGTHLGQHITVTIGHASITDTLAAVEHKADLILELPFGRGGRPTYDISRGTTVLRFRHAGEVTADERAEVTIHG